MPGHLKQGGKHHDISHVCTSLVLCVLHTLIGLKGLILMRLPDGYSQGPTTIPLEDYDLVERAEVAQVTFNHPQLTTGIYVSGLLLSEVKK